MAMMTLRERWASLPDHVVGEIVGGELLVSPRPGARHAFTSAALLRSLPPPPAAGAGGWWILHEPELHLGADVLVPDLAGWRSERLGALPDVPAFTLAPDWVCEVLSPATARVDRVRKLPRYAQAGVASAWLVDPQLSTLEAYERQGDRWTLSAVAEGRARLRVRPFETVELDLGSLWLPVANDAPVTQ